MTTESENIQPDIESERLEAKGLEMQDASPRKGASGHTKWWLLALVAVAAAAFGTAWLIFHKPAATPEPAAGVVPQQAETENTEAEATEAEAAEAEAAARAEFDAQMAKVNAVVQGADRTALIGDSPTKGPLDATVVLMKFSDFECPFCAIAAGEMKTFTGNHEEDVLYVYKHFPLVSIHDEALPAAKAAWAAQQQDQFWIYHDGLFAYQEKLGEDYYVELAEQIGLDMEQFNRDRNSPEAEAAVTQEAELARDLDLGGTPSFLMTNFTDSFLLPGGAPQELYDEAVARLEAAATQ
ncbi:MAG: thioredoxin domain-containing protein [Cyanobacteria bacterium J06634_6]